MERIVYYSGSEESVLKPFPNALDKPATEKFLMMGCNNWCFVDQLYVYPLDICLKSLLHRRFWTFYELDNTAADPNQGSIYQTSFFVSNSVCIKKYESIRLLTDFNPLVTFFLSKRPVSLDSSPKQNRLYGKMAPKSLRLWLLPLKSYVSLYGNRDPRLIASLPAGLSLWGASW